MVDHLINAQRTGGAGGLTGQYRIAAIANWLLTANRGAARQ